MIGGSGSTPWSDSIRGGAAVTFNEVLRQTIAMLQQHGRVSYRALKRQFALDDAFLDLLALAFQRTAGGENFLREIGRGVGEGGQCGCPGWRCGRRRRRPRLTTGPDEDPAFFI